MLKKLSIPLTLLLSFSAQAATSYSCSGCTDAQYERAAKQTTGDVYVYDLVKSNLKRYNVVLVTPAKDSPTGQDIKQVVPATPAQADIDFINKASRVRSNATSVSDTELMYHADVDLGGVAAFKDYSIYDITRGSSLQRQIANHLMYNNINNPHIKDALDVINDAGGNFIKVILKQHVVVVFKVKLGDGGVAVFIMSTSDIDGLPDFNVANSYDADMNSVITGNNSNAVGDYTITTEANLKEFTNHLKSLGIKFTTGGTGSWGCTPTETGVTCTHIN